MYRMTKPGGIPNNDLRNNGRFEHGTTRSAFSAASPGTTSIGWDYYMNLTRADFESAFSLPEMFAVHRVL